MQYRILPMRIIAALCSGMHVVFESRPGYLTIVVIHVIKEFRPTVDVTIFF
jgi:hypothetical protein